MAEALPPLQDRAPLYDAITCVLSCALENDNEVQKLANERKKKLEVIEEYPLILCEVIGSREEALAERHLAGVFLKNYLEELYLHTRVNAAFFERGMGTIIALQLLEYLNNSRYSKIRQIVAYNMALLLAMGFWDSLTLQLNDMVKSEDPDIINNAVFVLTQAIDEKFFSTQEDYRVEQHWFDVLLEVFKMQNIRSETRLNTIHPMFVMMKYVRPHSNYVPECWTKLSEEFEKALNEPYSPSSDFQFKSEILQCLNDSTDEFSEYCNIFVPSSLPAIGNLLTVCCEQYKKIVRGSDKAPRDPCEEDEENPTNFYELVDSILELIYSLVDMNYFDVLIDDLDNLLYCIFVFMACHDDMERVLFVDLLEKDHHWTIRDVCCQIITFALQKIEDRRRNGRALFFKSMRNVFTRLGNDAETSPDDLYKICFMSRLTESMIFGLGMVKERYSATDSEYVFPLNFFLNLWTEMLGYCNLMLQGRIIWIGGVYARELPPNLLDIHLKAVLQHLNGDDKYVLIPCAEALCNYLKIFKTESAEKKYIISARAKEIMGCLISVSRKSNHFPLNHSLNALGYFSKAHKEIAASNIDEIEDILIRTVVQHFADTFIMKEVNFVVAKLAQNQSFKILIHDKFLTFLQHIIHNLEPKEMRNDPDKALDILNTYTLHATTVDDYFILQTFMGAATLLSANTDREAEIDESAGNLLTTLIVKLANQLKFIQHTPKGRPVIEEFPKLLEKLLEPEAVIPGHVFGKLVITTIFSLPDLMQPHFETILRNVVTGSCKSYRNVRATWLIFAFICMIRTKDTLSYLSVLPGPNGGSALNFIMKMWIIDYIPDLHTIERKIMVLSLTQIIQNCLENESEYSKMEDVCIPFDQRPNESSPTGEVFDGMEYMYYLLVEFLFYEEKQQKITPLPSQPYDFADFGEDMTARKEEDDILLFHGHPFDIDIVNHIVTFLKTAREPYFNIVRKFVSSANYFRLRDLGCSVPDINIQEDME